MARTIKCKSGITGWQDRLQNVYTDLNEFERCCEIFNNHKRLGFKTPENAWKRNPMIQGSTNPDDYRKVTKK
jgi:hypothetical protein